MGSKHKKYYSARKKKIGSILKILMFIIISMVTLVFCEWLYRAIYYGSKWDAPLHVTIGDIGFKDYVPQELFISDHKLVFRNRPGFEGVMNRLPIFHTNISINNQGFRMDREVTERIEGELRIMILGDSTTFGQGVESYQSYPAQAEEFLLKISTKSQTSVLNCGTMATGPSYQSIWWKKIGHIYQPDFVVFGFFPLNDFYDELVFKTRRITGLSYFEFWMRSSSRILNRILLPFDPPKRELPKPAQNPQYNEEWPYELESIFLKNDSSNYLNEALISARGSISSLIESVESSGAEFLILRIPSMFELEYLSIIQTTCEMRERYDPDVPVRILREWFPETDIIDPLPLMWKSKNPRAYVIRGDGHPSSASHMLIGWLLASKIVERVCASDIERQKSLYDLGKFSHIIKALEKLEPRLKRSKRKRPKKLLNKPK